MRLALAALFCCGALVAGEFSIGSTVEKIKVTDHGNPAVINPSDAKATAVIFVSTKCPISNAYNDRFNELYRDYSGKGVQFAFVNANANETMADVDSHSKEQQFAFKVYKDVDNVLADKLNAQYTPEVFLFDGKGTLVYHGRIDDSREPANAKTRDARAAMDSVLSGKQVAVSDTKAFGCTIKRAKGTS